MISLISLQEHVYQIYEEMPKHLLSYTPQLFTHKEDAPYPSIQAHGSAVLIKREDAHYLITARHCIKQQPGKVIQLQVLNSDGIPVSITGLTTSIKGENDTLDLSVVHLQPQSVEHLYKCYQFLDYRKILPARHITEKTDYLVIGHTLSQTSIDNRRRTKSSTPFVHLGKSLPVVEYPKTSFTNAANRIRYVINPKTNTLIRYDKRKSTIMGSDEMSMGPQPKGISGCGVWNIPSYVLSDPAAAGYNLVGIIIEYHWNRRLLLATNAEQILSILP